MTMVQRSTTHIVRSDTLMEIGLGDALFRAGGRRRHDDRKGRPDLRLPALRILHEFQKPVYDKIRENATPISMQRSKKAGFMLDWGDDESGLFMKYLRRGSGYYIDVGASQLIIDGKIKLNSGSGRGDHGAVVVLDDGTELPADLIVYATGYGSMNGWVADLISQEIADKVGKSGASAPARPRIPGPWEGEQRNMWKPTQQEALWFHGGNLHQSRHYSQFLSLQLKARMEGIPTPVYGLQTGAPQGMIRHPQRRHDPRGVLRRAGLPFQALSTTPLALAQRSTILRSSGERRDCRNRAPAPHGFADRARSSATDRSCRGPCAAAPRSRHSRRYIWPRKSRRSDASPGSRQPGPRPSSVWRTKKRSPCAFASLADGFHSQSSRREPSQARLCDCGPAVRGARPAARRRIASMRSMAAMSRCHSSICRRSEASVRPFRLYAASRWCMAPM